MTLDPQTLAKIGSLLTPHADHLAKMRVYQPQIIATLTRKLEERGVPHELASERAQTAVLAAPASAYEQSGSIRSEAFEQLTADCLAKPDVAAAVKRSGVAAPNAGAQGWSEREIREATVTRLAAELAALGVPMPTAPGLIHAPTWEAVQGAPSSSFYDGRMDEGAYSAMLAEVLKHPHVRQYVPEQRTERADPARAQAEIAAHFQAAASEMLEELQSPPKLGGRVPKAPTGYERTTAELFADGMQELAPAPSKGGR